MYVTSTYKRQGVKNLKVLEQFYLCTLKKKKKNELRLTLMSGPILRRNSESRIKIEEYRGNKNEEKENRNKNKEKH